MPTLALESALFPETLFADGWAGEEAGRRWWVLRTPPRQEKDLSRKLFTKQIPFYLPLVRERSPSGGRWLTSYHPLFPGYVFLLGDGEDPRAALPGEWAVGSLAVVDQHGLWHDLRQVHHLLTSGLPVTPEERPATGMAVEIQNGLLAGLRGKINRTASGRRFVAEVHCIRRGASVLLEDFVLTRIE